MDELPPVVHVHDDDNDPNGVPILLRKEFILGNPVTCVSLPCPQVCLYAQGPYLQQVQMVNVQNVHDNDDNDNSNASASHNGWSQVRWRLLVFEDGGTIHGIRYSRNGEWHTSNDNNGNNLRPGNEYAVVFGGHKLALLKKSATSADDGIDPFQIIKTTISSHASSLDAKTFTTTVTLLDWIWDVRLLLTSDPAASHSSPDAAVCQNQSIILAVGLAHNEVEIYRFVKTQSLVDHNDDEDVFQRLPFRRFVGNTRCVTYSLAFQHHWAAPKKDDTASMPSLQVAVGTASHDIIIWNAYDNGRSFDHLDSQTTDSVDAGITTVHCPQSHCLQGHEGVIHAIQFHQKDRLLASASDDRSVRLWRRVESEGGTVWTMMWVGWGHSARVWRVCFCPSVNALISTAEDGTARVWCLETGLSKEELHVAYCPSVWSVDVHDSLAVLGGNDGTVALVDLKEKMSNPGRKENGDTSNDFETFLVPDDRKETTMSTGTVYVESNCTGTLEQAEPTKRKKPVKQTGQVVFGMEYYPLSQTSPDSKLLVATRSGSLMTLNLPTSNGTWIVHEPWCPPSMLQSHGIDPAHGCCLCIHGSKPLVVVGTTRGDIVLTRLMENVGVDQKNSDQAILSAEQYKSVQSVHWASQSLLISFHVQGIVLLWDLTGCDKVTRSTECALYRVFDMETKAVPLSFAFNTSMTAFAVGDSRGTIALFQEHFMMNSGVDEITRPSDVANRVHQKEHVTGILFQRENRIVSVGNDGCLVESAIDDKGVLHKLLSVPVGNLTGINHLWAFRNPFEAERLIVGGYFGNKFVALDASSGYELFRVDTGGRQRNHDCYVVPVEAVTSVVPYSCGLAVLSSHKDGRNEVNMYRKQASRNLNELALNYDLCAGLHGETIFDVSLMSLSSDPNSVILLSGSEDRKSKLSLFENGQWKLLKTLSPQESCVRCVACSRRPNDRTALLAVGGGKVTIQFFSIELRDGSSLDDAVIRFLGRGHALVDAAIDHRVNAVKAIPVGRSTHLVVTGDSDGNLYSYVVDESETCRPSFSGRLACALSRPILCVDLVEVLSSNILVVGTTSGDISIFGLSRECPDAILQVKLAEYKAHQMGTNCITTSIQHQSEKYAILLIGSGGDDQAITICAVNFAITADHGLQLTDLRLQVTKEASSSALKGVKFLGASILISAGYSQRLAMWEVSNASLKLELQQSVMVDVGDVNSMGHCTFLDAITGTRKDVIAVCGAGVDLFIADRRGIARFQTSETTP